MAEEGQKKIRGEEKEEAREEKVGKGGPGERCTFASGVFQHSIETQVQVRCCSLKSVPHRNVGDLHWASKNEHA
jgi:hypothetical protein